MELFPAADDDPLSLIKNVIDDSDHYLIILGGRYGRVDAATAKSYTHLEYEYPCRLESQRLPSGTGPPVPFRHTGRKQPTPVASS